MERLTKGALAAFLLALLAGAALAGEEVTKDGVLHVMNGSQPSGKNETVTLQEVWRHGGEDDEDFFGLITQCVVGQDGNVYLLDTRMSEVPVYSPTGERVATLSREGDGPGETRTPSNLLFMPDGSLGIVQVFPGKITKVGLDGTPVGVVEVGGDPTAGGLLQLFDCVPAGDQLIVAAESIHPEPPTAQTRSNFVAAFDQDGKEKVRFFEHSVHWDFTNFTFDEAGNTRIDFRKVAAGQDGRVYIAVDRNDYRINVYTPDGKLERVIEREYVSRDRSEQDYNLLKSILETQLAQIPNAKIVIGKNEPDIGAVSFGRDGNLWVTSSRSGFDEPEGTLITWDVFNPDGHFIKTVSARCEGDGENDILFWTPEGNAVMVTGFTEGMRAFQSRGAGDEDDSGDAAPMEVVYLKVAGN